LNRFLPAVRALFFIAAGMAGLRAWRVLFFALVSAFAWNGLIIAAGYGVGANWNRLREIFQTYALIAWLVIGGVLLIFILRWIILRYRSRSLSSDHDQAEQSQRQSHKSDSQLD
jgi:membrane protein DedA with SNARE-associated domain